MILLTPALTKSFFSQKLFWIMGSSSEFSWQRITTMIILGEYLSLCDIEFIISPISYDLINSCQVRDKFSSTKLLGTKFSWSRYFVWDIPLWTFQKVSSRVYPFREWLGKKELDSLSFISLWCLSTCSDRACHTNFLRINSVFLQICYFNFGQIESRLQFT